MIFERAPGPCSWASIKLWALDVRFGSKANIAWPAIGKYLAIEFNTHDFPMGMFDGFFRIGPNRTGANSILFREEPDAWSGHHQSHQRAAGLRLHRQTHRMDATHQAD
jgi:hypothetical protein